MQKKIAILGHQSITKFVADHFLKNDIEIDTIIGLDKNDSEFVADYFDIADYSQYQGYENSHNKIDNR